MNAYEYDDIHLIPEHSVISSRSKADTSVSLGNHKFKLPVIPANMGCVIDADKAHWFSENGYFYIMHRFGADNKSFVAHANKKEWRVISISMGIRELDSSAYEQLASSGHRIDYITIDVAHAHSDAMHRVLRRMKVDFPNTFIIAGNVATAKAVKDLEDWGADAVKVGIGGGSPCSTKYKTGFTVPMFSCVRDCSCPATVPIIADGGIKHNGDIAKALAAGATMVMAGGLFVTCKDSPAEHINMISSKFGYNKRYYGSASSKNKGHNKHIEGLEVEVAGNGMTYFDKLQEISEDLKSSISYAGGKDLSSFLSVCYNSHR